MDSPASLRVAGLRLYRLDPQHRAVPARRSLTRVRPSRQRRGAGFTGPYSHERRSSSSNGCHGALQGRLTLCAGAHFRQVDSCRTRRAGNETGGAWCPVAPRATGRFTTPGPTGATEWDRARGSSPATVDGAGSARSPPDPPRSRSARGDPRTADRRAHRYRSCAASAPPSDDCPPVGDSRTGGLFLNVSKSSSGFRVAMDDDLRAGMDRGIDLPNRKRP